MIRALLFACLTGWIVLSASQTNGQEKAVIGKIIKKKAEATTNKQNDGETLKSAKLSASDAPGLIKYFQSRTLNDEQSKEIKLVIQRFSDDVFKNREKASDDMLKFGAAAIGPLKSAIATNSDPEVVFRCEDARRRIETISQATIAMAAARSLVKLKAPDATAAMLAFLPTADNEMVADEIRKSLTELAVKDGKADAAIVKALTDTSPVRRSAAAVALAEGAKTPDAITSVKAMITKESDQDARYAAIVSLIVSSKSADMVPKLIEQLPELPRGRLWQAEDLLLQLASDKGPKTKYGKTKETVEKFRDEWQKWWKENESKVSFEKFKFSPRTDGSILLVEWNANGWGNGAVTLLGPNMKERVKLENLAHPVDAVLLPGNRIAVAEQNNSRVTIRDFNNEIITTIQDNQPVGLQLLPGEKLYITNRNGAAEYDLSGKQLWKYDRPNNNHDVMGSRKLPNGDSIYFVNSDQKNNCVRVDSKGKDVGKPFNLGQPYYNPAIEVISDDEFLVTDYSKIQKYSFKENKVTWSHNINNATSLQRLPNGNYLYAVSNMNKIVEITPEKEEVWEYQVNSGMRLMRAYRR